MGKRILGRCRAAQIFLGSSPLSAKMRDTPIAVPRHPLSFSLLTFRSPLPRYPAVKRARVARVEDGYIRLKSGSAGDRVHRGGVPLVQKVSSVEENGEALAQFHPS